MFRILLVRGGRGAMAALRRPWVSIALSIVFVVDACSLPRATTFGRRLGMGNPRCGCGSSRNNNYSGGETVIVQRGDQLALLSGEPAWDTPLTSVIATVTCDPSVHEGGVWAITRQHWNPAIIITSGIRTLTADETERVRNEFADIVQREQWSPIEGYAELVRANASPGQRIVWGGYVHNVLSAMMAVATILSFGWVRDRWRERGETFAMEKGLCPACRYDLRGEMSGGCPECGWRRANP